MSRRTAKHSETCAACGARTPVAVKRRKVSEPEPACAQKGHAYAIYCFRPKAECLHMGEPIAEAEPEQCAPVRFVTSRRIRQDSWLHRYPWFVKAHAYASCKTNAIAGLASIDAEDLYFVFTFMLRDLGGEVVGGKLTLSPPTEASEPSEGGE